MRLLVYSLISMVLTCICCNHDNGEEIKLLFTGDIMLSRNVSDEISQKKINPWYKILSDLKHADLVIGNLEGAVGRNTHFSNASNLIFGIPEEYISLLKEAGFSVITLENNHSYDLGATNKDTAIIKLYNAGIAPVTIDNSPYFIRVQDRTISIIAINLIEDQLRSQDTIPSISIQQKLKLARSLSDFVIVTIHWGNELLNWPGNNQRKAAEWLIDNGTDLIVGHHPHVIQNPEIIKGKPVFFSLGNHLFDQKYYDSKRGLILECIISRDRVRYNGIITKTIKNSFFPEIEKRISFQFKKARVTSADAFHNYYLKPISILQGKEGKVILTGSTRNNKIWTSQPISLIGISEARFDNQVKYLFTLERHYSSLDKENAPRPYVYKITDTGLQALWRGSGLSRPLIDAALTKNKKYLIALHRNDSFVRLNRDSDNAKTFIEAYKWNGFGFSGLRDSSVFNEAKKYYQSIQGY